MSDLPDPATELSGESAPARDGAAEVRPWWRRSPGLAAAAAVAIGLGTLWFGDMLGRVPLGADATLGYLLMLPLLLIVPAFSAAGLRLSWIALQGRGGAPLAIGAAVAAATAANVAALGRFVAALVRIFGH
ncbi:MAG TPA: hypothetical protein VFV71_05605 [Burkholderiales bacterium]|nr:hypothetical protein [Burkholderiales bacterium]